MASLNEIVAHLNSSLYADDPVDGFHKSMNALNKLWNSAFRLKLINTSGEANEDGNNETTDGKKFRALIGLLYDNELGNIFVRSREFKELVELEPPVMDMKILEDNSYDPSNIEQSLRRKASKKHNSLSKEYEDQLKKGSPNQLLKWMSALLYIIRSNIDHGEKTPKGPDLEKSTRDKTVCEKALPVTKRLLEILLNEPSKYLATYGTLKENEIIKKYSEEATPMPGKWSVEGNVETSNGLLYFNWISKGKRLPVTIYEISEESYGKLDKYEGNGYRRIYVPVFNSSEKVELVATIYAKNKH